MSAEDANLDVLFAAHEDITLDALFKSVDSGDMSLDDLFTMDGGGLPGWRDDDEDHEDQDTVNALEKLNGTLKRRSGKGRRGAGRKAAEDYDGAQREAFLMLCDNIAACFEKSRSAQNREDAIQWVFGMESPVLASTGVSFITCCRAMGIREWVVQSRIQFQFSADRISLDLAKICGLFIQLPPERLISEANYMIGEYAYPALRWIWEHPGSDTDAVKESGLSSKELWLLEEHGVLTEAGGLWYLTGRNPGKFDMMGKANYRGWSSLF